ncbi:epoxide hydrolase 1-like, partial [Tropilaelaps mercedesae]
VNSPPDDEAIYHYTIAFDAEMVTRLKEELSRTRWVDPLDGSNYKYGVNLKTFQKVIDYWKNQFDFNRVEDDMNSFPNYQTQIEGLNIHFFRSVPSKLSDKVKVVPLLMIHGWPGSFVEFLKVARLLSKPVNRIAFDIIVLSIPGYGFSQGSHKPGMNVLATARIFMKLMTRLGYTKFYVQGGEYGSMITLGLINSPAGLAAYILEKFSSGTQRDFEFLEGRGLDRKFFYEELLSI